VHLSAIEQEWRSFHKGADALQDWANVVGRHLQRWRSPMPTEQALAPYLRILADSSPTSSRVRLAAQAAGIASLIHQSADILDLRAASPCSKHEVMLGDLYLASSGHAVSRTASSELELRFSDAVMAMALRQDHAGPLARIVAACLERDAGGYATGRRPAPAPAVQSQRSRGECT